MKNNSDSNSLQFEPRYNDSGFLSGLVLGSALGAAAFFLFGTVKGREIKEKLVEVGKEYFAEFEENLPEIKREFKKASETIMVQSQKIAEKTKDKVVQAAQDNLSPAQQKVLQQEVKKLEDTTKEATKKVEQMQAELEKTAQRIEHKFFLRKGKTLKK